MAPPRPPHPRQARAPLPPPPPGRLTRGSALAPCPSLKVSTNQIPSGRRCVHCRRPRAGFCPTECLFWLTAPAWPARGTPSACSRPPAAALLHLRRAKRLRRQPGRPDARFHLPQGITVSPTGDVVVADRLNNALRLVSKARLVQGAVTSRPAGATSQLRSIGLGATRSTTSLGAHVPRPRKSCVVGAPGAASRHL